MSKKINDIKKDTSGKQRLTPLQTTAISILMTILLFISIGSMVTHSSGKKPSENIFKNSQTIRVLNQ